MQVRRVASAAVLVAAISWSGVTAAVADAPRPPAAAKATSDFNGDGYQDLAVGRPSER